MQEPEPRPRPADTDRLAQQAGAENADRTEREQGPGKAVGKDEAGETGQDCEHGKCTTEGTAAGMGVAVRASPHPRFLAVIPRHVGNGHIDLIEDSVHGSPPKG